MKKLSVSFWILLFSISFVSHAQNSISLSNRNSIFMELTHSFNAGVPRQITIDDSQWLNYTTLVQPPEPTFSISVEVAMGSIPDGLELQIEASPCTGRSNGRVGAPTKKLTLSHVPKVLINNIGTCYTGSEKNEGHRITFSVIVADYSKLRSGTFSIYVQYTITQ